MGGFGHHAREMMAGGVGAGGTTWGGGSPSRRYDRQKLTLKDIHNCQYVACMNPTSGSFTIDPRLQVGRSQTPLIPPPWG